MDADALTNPYQSAQSSLRIVIVAPGLGYEAGAVPMRARLVGNELVRRGHEVIGIGLRSSRFAAASAGFPVTLLPEIKLPRPFASLICWFFYDLLAAVKIIRFARVTPIDVVVSHWQGYGLSCALVRAFTVCKWVSLVQRTIFDMLKSGRQSQNVIMNWFNVIGSRYEFSHSSLVIVLHEEMKAEIQQHVMNASDIVVIPNGVTLTARPFEELWASKTCKTVLYAGRLDAEKCVDVVIRGFASMRCREAQLVIIGDGEKRIELEALAEQLGLTERVTFSGHRTHKEVLAAMHSAPIFTLMSVSEGLPFVILEAMASGCAIVCSSIAGNRAALEETDTVFVTAGDSGALAAALDEIFESRERRLDLSRRAYERSKAFDWTQIIDREVGVYENLGASTRK